MASQVRRLGVEVYMNAAGYVGGVNRVLYGTTRLAQGFRSAASTSRILDNQMKAIGTTMRYALAGSVVFGVTGALSRLQDFETELGTIDSLAGRLNDQGKFKGLGGQLQDLGSDAIKMSDKYGTAVTDVESYMERFYSTFSTRNRKDVDGFTKSVLNLQTALGSEAGDPSALAGGIGGLVNVIPGGKRHPGQTATQIANMIAKLTQVTPNLTGQDISNAAGRLAAIYNTSGMTPQQLFAVYAQAAKAGGSPSIVTRGVTQLLGMSLLHPKTATNRAAYAAAGLPTDPTALRNLGGVNVLERLMQFVAPQGVTRAEAQKASRATNKAQLKAALPGLNTTELYGLFGRIQSVQQFVNIMSQGGVPALRKMVKVMDAATDSNLAAKKAMDALREQGLKVLSNDMANVGLSLVRSLNVPLSYFGRGVGKLSDELAGHRTTTTVAESTLTGAVLARMLGRTSLGTKLVGRIPGPLGKYAEKLIGTDVFGKAASAAITTEEAGALIAGQVANGTREQPFWVVIAPVSWKFAGAPTGGTSTTTKSTIEDDAKNVAKKVAPTSAALAARYGTVAAVGAAALPATVVGVGAYEAYKHGRTDLAHEKQFQKAQQRYTSDLLRKREAAERRSSTRTTAPAEFHKVGKSDLGPVMKALQAANIDNRRQIDAMRSIEVKGTAKAEMVVRLVDAHGRTILVTEKKGVPIAITKDTAPQSQGRAKVRSGR